MQTKQQEKKCVCEEKERKKPSWFLVGKKVHFLKAPKGLVPLICDNEMSEECNL